MLEAEVEEELLTSPIPAVMAEEVLEVMNREVLVLMPQLILEAAEVAEEDII
jgi:hypothetical protein